MAKLKTPLLSFRADGSIGKQITFSHVKGATIAKKIPSHPDARTLPQLYQRWRFTDARYYWKSLSNATRAAYESAARPHHMTGWAWFLSSYLTTPLDQVLHLHLDTQESSPFPDHSGSGNHGTAFGTARAAGIINGALFFDRVDDYVDCGNDSSLDITGAITFMIFVQSAISDYPDWGTLMSKGDSAYRMMIWQGDDLVRAVITDEDDGIHEVVDPTAIDTNRHHYAGRFDGATLSLFRDGLSVGTPKAINKDIKSNAYDLYIGENQEHTGRRFNGIEDDPRIYTRGLTDEHILEIATMQFYPGNPT